MSSASRIPPLGQQRRTKMQKRLHGLQQRENAENKQAIAQLQQILKQKDEELASLTAEQMETLDVEMEDDGSGEPESPSASGEDTEEDEKEKKKAKKDVKKKKKKSSKEAIFDSIESPDASNDGQDGIFKKDPEPDPEPEPDSEFGSDYGSDYGSDADADSDRDSGIFVDSDNHKALYTPPGSMPVGDAKTVGWSDGRFKGYINMYGQKSAARYRLEGLAFPQGYDESENERVSNPNNRYGDELLGSGKPKYTRRHIRGIFGVAWKAAGSRISRDDLNCINPEVVTKWREVPTYVLIAWDINGEIQKTWETRSCLRKRWGTKDADRAIYEAAIEAEDRYVEAKTGERPANSRSPSVGLARGHVRKHREKSLGMNKTPPPRSARTTRASKSPRRGTQTLEEYKQEFLDNYLELLGVQEFADLDISERRDCINTWKEEKALRFPAYRK